MEDRRIAKIGGICSIITGILYLIIAGTYFIIPAEQNPATQYYSSEFFSSIRENFSGQEILYWSLILSAVFGIAVVAAVSDLVRPSSEGLVHWTSTLATIGFGIQIAANVLGRDYVLRVSSGYFQLDGSVQSAINLQGNLFNDWVTFGLVGIWLITVNVLALRGGLLSRVLAFVGLISGVAYWLVVAGNIFEILSLITIAAGIGIFFLPLWYIWIGASLLQRRKIGDR